jgi:predicted enzyme related to lactoylglutathione lyase
LPKSAGKEGWSVYPTFIVSDVGEAIEKAEGLGGGVKTYVPSVLYSGLYADFYSPRTEIPNGMGVVGHVVDPDNNIIGLWSQK